MNAFLFRMTKAVALGIVLAAIPAPAGAQPPAPAPAPATARAGQPGSGDDPVLQALIAEALANNPDIATARAAITAAHTWPGQIQTRPAPMVSVTYTNDGWAPTLGSMQMTTLGFMVSQLLTRSGTERARLDLAAKQSHLAEPVLDRVRLSITASVKRAYYGLLLARELLTLTDEQRELWRQIEVVTRARYAAGQGAQQDVLRVQVEVTRVEQRAIEQSTEKELRLAELNRLLARPATSRLEPAGRLSVHALTQPLAAVLDAARSISPELAQARLAVEADVSSLDLARVNFKPEFTIQGGYMNRGGLSPMWLAGMGVSWPKNKSTRDAAVAESQSRVDGSRKSIDAIDLQLRLRTQERFARATMAERIMTLYDQGIVPQDRMAVESAMTSYESGRIPFVSVLEAMSTLYADRWTRETQAAAHEALLASLEEASLDGSPDMFTVPAMPAPQGAGGSAAMTGGMGGR